MIARAWGVISVYLLTRHFFGRVAAAIAMAIVAVMQSDVRMASLLYPDAIAAFWANVAVGTALFAIQRHRLGGQVVWGLVAGVLFGVSWLCKETVAYLVPFVAIAIMLSTRTSPMWTTRVACFTAIGAGALSIVVAEALFYAHLTGDPLYRFHGIDRNYQQASVWFFDSSSPMFGWSTGGYTRALLRRLLDTGPRDIVLNNTVAYLPAVALVAASWGFLKQKTSWLIPTLWLLTLMLMFNFMTSSFSSYKPLPTFARYLYPILLPSLMLSGGLIAALATSAGAREIVAERRLWACVVTAFLATAIVEAGLRTLTSRPQDTERSVSRGLSGNDVVYTDYRTAANLVFFRARMLAGSNESCLPWEKVDVRTLPSGAYVLVNTPMIEFLASDYRYSAPEFALNPPAAWKLVRRYGNASLFVVGAPVGS